MMYVIAGALLLFFFASSGRRAKQRQALAGLRQHFPETARATLDVRVPALRGKVSEDELSRLFEWIYAEHLRRSGAKNFGDLMGKSIQLGAKAEFLSIEICRDAADRLGPSAAQQLANDRTLLNEAGDALHDALRMAGETTQAEIDGKG